MIQYLIRFRQILTALTLAGSFFLLFGAGEAVGAGMKQLHGHVPVVTSHLQSIGEVKLTNELHLGIGVQLRDPEALDRFLTEVYDPASPNYKHFLTPAEFAARFSATEADYGAVKKFALKNGFKIRGTYENRLLLDVTAPAANVEKAFHVRLKKYKHPTESREFFAPDVEPSVDAKLAVIDIQGLSDYAKPRPKFHRSGIGSHAAKNGTAPDGSGSYFGDDFRNAYVPGTTLTGAGQTVGLFELDGFYPSDIAAYARQAGGGRTNINVQTVMIGNRNWFPDINGGVVEVSLDIEMAMAMAPGLSKILVFESASAADINSILENMAASNTVTCLSSSWGWGEGPSTTTDNIFKTMAAQGQSFFNASGDSAAFTVGSGSINGVDNPYLANAPSSSPYITQVGGTTLAMNGNGGSYGSETVWNVSPTNDAGVYTDSVGSSGGVSSYYPIPAWQANLNMAVNHGSSSQRNIPDVAMAADNIFVTAEGGETWLVGGTSCAAPLWAGFMALVNQQAALANNPPAGFINPAIYSIGRGGMPQYKYTLSLHDILTGNNESSNSPLLYPACRGYDLCTGWGSPSGTNLINALGGLVSSMVTIPSAGFTARGIVGGPFSGGSQTLMLSNTASAYVSWSLVNTSAWLSVSSYHGILAPASVAEIAVSLSSGAGSSRVGTYNDSIVFSNMISGGAFARNYTLQILSPLAVTPGTGFVASGPVGGSFSPTAQGYSLTNLSNASINWGVVNTSSWLNVSASSGSLPAAAVAGFTVALSPQAYLLPAGNYSATVLVTNQNIISANLPFILRVGQSIVQNGGFETGDFSGWTLVGDSFANFVADASFVPSGVPYVHSGNFGAAMGQYGGPALLSQSFATIPGQSYTLSFWTINPTNLPTENFQVGWSTNGSNFKSLYSLNSPAAFSWTNKTFVVTATGTNSALEFVVENDQDYFGIDDVSLVPFPSPTFTRFVNNNGSLALSWNGQSGVSYLVQYKTNLSQSSWINIYTNTAVSGTVSFTNTPANNPSGFYRVQQLP